MAVKIIPDPDNVPITHVTGVASAITNGQTVMMNMITDRMVVLADGSVRNDLVIASRLRFDLDVARRIRDQLNAHLSSLTAAKPGSAKPN